MNRDIMELNGKEVMVVVRTDELVLSTVEDRVSSMVADDKGISIMLQESQIFIGITKEKVADVFVLEDETHIVLQSGLKIIFQKCLTDPVL